MKTIKNVLIVLTFFAPTLVFGQKMITPKSNQFILKSTFKVSLNATDCYLQGKTIQANLYSLDNRHKIRYSYAWEVDGIPYGHSSKIECVSGEIATVHVTQYPSGIRVSKSIKISNSPERQ